MKKQTRNKIIYSIAGVFILIFLLHPVLMDFFPINNECYKMANTYQGGNYVYCIHKRRFEVGKMDSVQAQFQREMCIANGGYVHLDKGGISFGFKEINWDFDKSKQPFDTTQHIDILYRSTMEIDKGIYMPIYKKIHYKVAIFNENESKLFYYLGNIRFEIFETLEHTSHIQYEGTMIIKGICSAKKAEELIKREVKKNIVDIELENRKKRIQETIIEMIKKERSPFPTCFDNYI